MKTGIVTITGEANYGNSLQNYAVEQVLRSLGAEPETIEYPFTDRLPLKQSVKNIAKKLLGRGYNKQSVRRSRFAEFNNSRLHIRPMKNAEYYDYLVCGSDQIWNPKIFQVGRHLGYYFADFAPGEKRVAYSASIGIDFIPDNYREQFDKYLREMRAISVRETKAAELIKELTDIDSTVTIDPTLMLPKEKWLEIARKPKYINDGEKFILTYFLGNISSELSGFIKAVSDRYGYKVISLDTEWLKDNEVRNDDWFCTAPDELIWLINNCRLLITDSYHGSVFSIMLEKPFRCFSRAGGTSAGSRMETLFRKFKVDSWCIGRLDEDIEGIFETDFPCSADVLKEERETAIGYLKDALNITGAVSVVPDKNTCVGCEACVNICPTGCISMAEDEEGFLYPVVDKDKCTGCRACASVCIAEKIEKLNTVKQLECYACISKDDETRARSSSGGIFSLLAQEIIESGGTVYGACYDENMAVKHMRAEATSDLEKMRGSKYAQSRIGNIYALVKKDLESGRAVLFSGTGCQINGLKAYLRKDYDKLYTADVVCHGVPNQQIFSKYLEYRNMGRIESVNFKDKSSGWTKPNIKITSDKSTYVKNLYLDEYALLFSDGVTLRKSCYNCYSQAAKNQSDLSLGDFWGIENADKSMFDNKGTSLVLVKSEKGQELLDKISDRMIIKAEGIDDAVKRNPNLVRPTRLTERRDKFFGDYRNSEKPDFRRLADKYCTFYNKSTIQKLKIRVKRILGKEA